VLRFNKGASSALPLGTDPYTFIGAVVACLCSFEKMQNVSETRAR